MAKRKNSFQVLFSFISQDIHNLPLYYNHALRREHVTSSKVLLHLPRCKSIIPNNPYIIAVNASTPGRLLFMKQYLRIQSTDILLLLSNKICVKKSVPDAFDTLFFHVCFLFVCRLENIFQREQLYLAFLNGLCYTKATTNFTEIVKIVRIWNIKYSKKGLYDDAISRGLQSTGTVWTNPLAPLL